MPALQVRDFPEELYEELRAYAEANHRSIAQQTIACVENELRRSRARMAAASRAAWSVGGAGGLTGAAEGLDGSDAFAAIGDDVPIPSFVHEAALRAESIDPFSWLKAFEIESDEVRETRRAKWEKLRERFAEMDKRWKGPKPTCEEIAQMIREDRDERTNRIIESVSTYEVALKGE